MQAYNRASLVAISTEKHGEPGIFSHVSMTLSRFSVLIATESWAGPRNEATTEPHCLVMKKTKKQLEQILNTGYKSKRCQLYWKHKTTGIVLWKSVEELLS